VSEPLRLQVYMARCGIDSRRGCEQYISAGRVSVNGKIATLGSKVSEGDRVELDGRLLRFEPVKVYLAVNKPRGYLCSNIDRRGRPLVSDLLRDIPLRLFHVGRLDLQSSGLILYTNDGQFAALVTHPSYGIEKEYIVEAEKPIPETALRQYRQGISVGGEHYRLKSYEYKTARKAVLILLEGKNREIRRVFDYFKVVCKRIHRVRIGCVEISGLPSGGYRHLSQGEVAWLLKRQQARIDGSRN
jgi:23S rRNA pseudouridine2605 synthase